MVDERSDRTSGRTVAFTDANITADFLRACHDVLTPEQVTMNQLRRQCAGTLHICPISTGYNWGPGSAEPVCVHAASASQTSDLGDALERGLGPRQPGDDLLGLEAMLADGTALRVGRWPDSSHPTPPYGLPAGGFSSIAS